jgi:hypothetical protein
MKKLAIIFALCASSLAAQTKDSHGNLCPGCKKAKVAQWERMDDIGTKNDLYEFWVLPGQMISEPCGEVEYVAMLHEGFTVHIYGEDTLVVTDHVVTRHIAESMVIAACGR